jgi:hypothetical protein
MQDQVSVSKARVEELDKVIAATAAALAALEPIRVAHVGKHSRGSKVGISPAKRRQARKIERASRRRNRA